MTTKNLCRLRRRRAGTAWLEVLLVLAFLGLVFQVFPSLWPALCRMLDIRSWSRGTWMAINVLILAALFSVRFGREALADLRERKERLASRRRADSAKAAASAAVEDAEARRRRDAEWVARAKKRLPWQ